MVSHFGSCVWVCAKLDSPQFPGVEHHVPSLLNYHRWFRSYFISSKISISGQTQESLSNDALQLRDTLLNLFKVFGPEVRSSIVVIVTKPNMKPEEAALKRLTRIKEVMSQQGLRELVIWNGPERDQRSLDDLKKAIARAFRQVKTGEAARCAWSNINSNLSGATFMFHDPKGTVRVPY